MKKLLLLFAISLSFTVQAREATVSSPNGKLTVAISDDSGLAKYSVSLEQRQMVLPSALGFKADFGDFTKGLKIVNTSARQIDREYDMRQVKQSHFHYVATLLTVDFENDKGQKMSAEFSVSDNDVAFRYLIPRQ